MSDEQKLEIATAAQLLLHVVLKTDYIPDPFFKEEVATCFFKLAHLNKVRYREVNK